MEEKNEATEDNKKLTKEEIKRQKKEEKEAKKREEKAKKKEEKRLKKEKNTRDKEIRQSLKLSQLSYNKRLKSSGQILPSNIHNFDFITKELPDSFFEDVLEKEMELSEEFSIDKLTSLIKLYSRAMEYYLQVDPPKANDYQGRMEFLLTNKDTLKKLKKQSDNLSIKKNQNSDKIKLENQELNLKTNGNKIKEEMKKNIEYKTENLMFDDIINKVTEVIGDSNIKDDVQKTKNIIENELEKQKISWKEKLKNKKKGNLRSSMIPLGNKKLNATRNKFLSSPDIKFDLNGPKIEKRKMKSFFNDFES